MHPLRYLGDASTHTKRERDLPTSRIGRYHICNHRSINNVVTNSLYEVSFMVALSSTSNDKL